MTIDIKKSKKHNLKGKKLLKRLCRATKKGDKDKENKLYKQFLARYY